MKQKLINYLAVLFIIIQLSQLIQSSLMGVFFHWLIISSVIISIGLALYFFFLNLTRYEWISVLLLLHYLVTMLLKELDLPLFLALGLGTFITLIGHIYLSFMKYRSTSKIIYLIAFILGLIMVTTYLFRILHWPFSSALGAISPLLYTILAGMIIYKQGVRNH